ncbi:site-specific DNA-methyltransferase [uncultured Parvimonas sp.]|uniref:site-specific DNA-methyltransferase n=1 Tax=uncultured Parvimonas sp. TaxID=747372 RepID=UPI00288AB33A|nr:site-specific DNA-methyltransferase [uncultured Parvimonas sp.]
MKFLDELKKVLSFDERFVGESNQIIKTKVSDAARANDGKLLKALLNNDLLKEAFFTKVDDVYVFDKNRFVWVLESKEFLPDSFTIYKNKIGLIDSNNNLISQKQDVSLVWPYKDCVLDGGQTKEDQKRDEIFYNETLAPDQVNRLLAPKVLGNAKRYTKDGLEENIKFREDDNLIIKGNNLIALTSLLERYEGQVKCIYIDPPYNTGSDSFCYNDSFNHSSWLTFMKNRLEISKKLLSNSGSIFIQIDSFEQAYLKIIMDEIFGRENFRNAITWKRKGGSANPSNQLNNVTEWILWYSKDVYEMEYSPVFTLDDENTQKYIKERFTFVDEYGRKYMKSPIQSPNYRENLIYDYKGYKTPKKGYSVSKEVMQQWDKEGRLAFPNSKDKNINRKIFLDEYKGQPVNSLWSDIFVINPMSSERIEFGAGQKPEALIKRILSMVTNEGDIVLDYCLGSGSSCSVAQKMKRRYIGVEQMDYINTVSVPRLEKVIEGEQGGISKSVNWQGGGSFVYCELLEDNESLVNELEKAENTEQVKIVLNKAIDNGKLIPSVLPRDLKENEDDFDKLSLDEQKNLVMELLNKNQLYVNLSDIDDEDYKVSEADKVFTRSFYGKE